jgi:GNAT superfamily N-acetyltransferase
MGRLVGDGHIYVHVQDVLVIPEFQRMGVGRRIMDEIFKWLDANVTDNTNIGLFASKGREGFYRPFGFEDRPNERFGSGMMMTKRDIRRTGT